MPVRLLHTSDWHLGHELHDVDRAPEHRRFLSWLVERCEAERVHALLVAGDVFDVSNPPAAALATWADFLVTLWRRMPELRVIVIGGNHDSAHRLEMTEAFHAALGRLHVLGAVPRLGAAIDLDRAIVRVEGEGESALVAAVPFLRAADLRASELDGDESATVRRVLAEVLDGARARRRDREAIVAMGHLFVAGGTAGASERVLIGGMGAVPPDVYPPDVAYAALGHLHRAQTIAGRLRYCGPPIPLAFDEVENPHEVVLVELHQGAVKEARGIAVPQTRALLRVPADDFRPLAEVLAALRSLSLPDVPPAPEQWPLVEVRVTLEQPEPNLRGKLEETLSGKAVRLVRTQVRYAREGGPLTPKAGQALADLDPVQVFRERWARDFEGDPSPDVLAAYGEVLEEARGQVEGGR